MAEPVLLINPQDRDRIGVEDGGQVRVTSSRGSLTLPVRADAGDRARAPRTSRSTCPATASASWWTSTTAVTDLRVESLS